MLLRQRNRCGLFGIEVREERRTGGDFWEHAGIVGIGAPMPRLQTKPLVLAALLAASWPAARAQASCSSDGQPPPVALLERFISADCEACWSAPDTPRPQTGALAIDWIVPCAQGEGAPLSAAASRDALQRLAALGRPAPADATTLRRTALAGAQRLRVAHGLPFNDYIGASIELRPARSGPWTAWLLLVETIAAGSEGTPVERNLARNLLVLSWDGRRAHAARRLFESRPMAIAANARPERLRVVGWVEDARGRIRSIAQTVCVPER